MLDLDIALFVFAIVIVSFLIGKHEGRKEK